MHFRRSGGTNIVYTAAQKAGDLGAVIAVIWFIFMLVSNDWSLNIMVIAWYHPANYWDMQEWQQRTCLEILSKFYDEGIDFVFPSRTLYLANDNNHQLKLKMLEDKTVTHIPGGGSNE